MKLFFMNSSLNHNYLIHRKLDFRSFNIKDYNRTTNMKRKGLLMIIYILYYIKKIYLLIDFSYFYIKLKKKRIQIKHESNIYNLRNYDYYSIINNNIQSTTSNILNSLKTIFVIFCTLYGINTTNCEIFGSSNIILTGCLDGLLKSWEICRENIIGMSIKLFSKPITHIVYLKRTKEILINSLEKKIYKINKDRLVFKIDNGKLFTAILHDIRFPNSFLTGCSDNNIYEWSTEGEHIVRIYKGHLGLVNSLNFIRYSKNFISSSEDRTFRVWYLGIPIRHKEIRKSFCNKIIESLPMLNFKYVAYQTSFDKIFISYIDDSKILLVNKVLMGHSLNNIPCNLAFEEFFKICMSGDKDGNLLIWKWKVNAFPIISIKIHKTVSKHINLIRNDNTIITGSWDGFLKGWEYY